MARYRFGVFEADERSGELTRAGRRVHLAPQPFRALLLLLERAGAVVTREELRRALWDERTHVEFDQSVGFAIGRIRLALGDNARAPRFLETLPRRGYRFLANVERYEDAPRPAPAFPPAPRRWPILRRAAPFALLAALIAQAPGAGLVAPPAARAAFERGQRLADEGRRRQSLVAFREAVRLDPGFAEAHFAIASIYTTLAESGELASREAFPIARAEAERALALEDVADSRLLLGSALFLYEWDRQAARREFERAVALAPASTATLSSYARLLSTIGDHHAATDAIDRAEALSPSCDLIVHESGWVAYRARRYAEAIRKFERAATLGPPHFTDDASWRKLNRFRVLIAHLQLGATRAADADAVEIARLAGTPPDRLATLRSLPEGEAAHRVLRRSVSMLAEAAEREYVSPVRFAELYAALGEDDEALVWLSRAAQERAPALAYSVADPVYDRLRSRPDFESLMRRLEARGRSIGG